MDEIIQILKTNGPMLSSDLASELERQQTISNVTARQKICRAKKNPSINYLRYIKFPKRVQLMFLKGTETDVKYYDKIFEAIKKTSSVYFYAISSIIAKQGAISQKRFNVFCGSPYRIKGHLSYENVLNNLIQDGICATDVISGENYIKLNNDMSNSNYTFDKAYAQNIAETVMIEAVVSWLKKTGLVSYNSIRTILSEDKDNSSEYGSFLWDITAPSYIYPLKNGKNPGFIVVDVLLNESINKEQVGYFIHKFNILKNQKNIFPFVAVLVGNYFAKEAFEYKNQGILLITVKNLFGEEVSKSLKELINSLANAAATAADNFNNFIKIYGDIQRLEGISNNLKGAFFEMLVGHCVKKIEGGTSFDIGKIIKIKSEGTKKEIDIILFTDRNQLTFYECKAYNSNQQVKKDEVEKWVTEKIPFIRKWIKLERADLQNYNLCFEFWTTSSFRNDAELFLKDSSLKTKKYTIGYKKGTDIIKYIRKGKISDSKNILDALEQYYGLK